MIDAYLRWSNIDEAGTQQFEGQFLVSFADNFFKSNSLFLKKNPGQFFKKYSDANDLRE